MRAETLQAIARAMMGNPQLAMSGGITKNYPRSDALEMSPGLANRGGGTPQPVFEPPSALQNALSDMARGNLTARQVQDLVRQQTPGWSVNLRGRTGEIEAFDPTGKAHWILP
jgi:hypothetical protein